VTLPDVLRRRIEQRVGTVRVLTAVGGGCINQAARVEVADRPAFLKYNPSAPPGFFTAEARALDALRAVEGGPRIPHVIDVFDASSDGGSGEPSWLLLEWLEPVRRTTAFGARLGCAVAALHAPADGGWGWGGDNFIGALPQANGPTAKWADFWRERRLEPQLRISQDAGRMPGTSREWDRLFAALPSALAVADDEGPSLLHGDLWSGNVLCTGDGEPALVDPAAYRGHREADLAMAELFGGFDAGFHRAYREARPLADGYETVRRPIYQLYYLLVHVNLFGGGYVAQAAAALRGALASGAG
jgi:protein-ribulosamine 3-kinase